MGPYRSMLNAVGIIDVFARKIVGWRVSRSMTTEFVLDALNQAICQRCPMEADNLIHHSDRGSQYLAIRYAERLVEAGIDPSVGSVGDSYDNALAECIIGLFKTEVINHIGPWRSMGQLEWATLKWVDWFNNERLLEPIGYITPAEAEEAYYANLKMLDKVAKHLNKTPSSKLGAVQFEICPSPGVLSPCMLSGKNGEVSAMKVSIKSFDVEMNVKSSGSAMSRRKRSPTAWRTASRRRRLSTDLARVPAPRRSAGAPSGMRRGRLLPRASSGRRWSGSGSRPARRMLRP